MISPHFIFLVSKCKYDLSENKHIISFAFTIINSKKNTDSTDPTDTFFYFLFLFPTDTFDEMLAQWVQKKLSDNIQLSRGEICVANFIPPCEWCKSEQLLQFISLTSYVQLHNIFQTNSYLLLGIGTRGKIIPNPYNWENGPLCRNSLDVYVVLIHEFHCIIQFTFKSQYISIGLNLCLIQSRGLS